MSRSDWDPMERKNVPEVPSPRCLTRLKSDLRSMYKEMPSGISIFPDENDVLNVHALILGPDGTPYEKGFFYFFLRIPTDYPMSPPRVRLMTTDGGSVRFNPNLYANGKVCLSILGTWPGPSWSPSNTLCSVLVSIQSLMCENPYFNEPGQIERHPGDSKDYNEMIFHETLRVAVCGMVNNDTGISMPSMMIFEIQSKFLELVQYYEQVCKERRHLDGKFMKDSLYNLAKHKFKYRSLMAVLQQLKSDFKHPQASPQTQ